MKRVHWAAAAIADLEGIHSYYAEDGNAAEHIVGRIVLATDWLIDWPYAGRPVAESGWRKWKPRRTAHVLIYRSIEDGIEVSRVRHHRENWLADL